MLAVAALLSLLPAYALAAIPNAGATTSDAFPPANSENSFMCLHAHYC
jgi:hypothetical protein